MQLNNAYNKEEPKKNQFISCVQIDNDALIYKELPAAGRMDNGLQ